MFADRYLWTEAIGPFNCDGVAATYPMFAAKGTVQITAAEVFNSASADTSATAYITLSLINLGTAGSGTTVIATASTSETGGSVVPGLTAFPLTLVSAAATVTDEQIVGFTRAEATTDGAALANCVVRVYYQQVSAD